MFNPRFSQGQTQTSNEMVNTSNRGKTDIIQNNILGDLKLRLKITNETKDNEDNFIDVKNVSIFNSITGEKTGLKYEVIGSDFAGLGINQADFFETIQNYYALVPTTLAGVTVKSKDTDNLLETLTVMHIKPNGKASSVDIGMDGFVVHLGNASYSERLRIDDFVYTTKPSYVLTLSKLKANTSIEFEFNIVAYDQSALVTESGRQII